MTTGSWRSATSTRVIAAGPDCAVYCAMGDTRPVEATNDVRKLLEAGIDVVGSAPGTLQFPWGTMPERVIEKVEASAQAGQASVYITGVDPGFASDLIPLALASTCQRVEQVRCYELADYATYDGAEVMFDLMGFGQPVTDTPLLFLPGVLALAWGTAIRMMAAGLGIEIDEIVEFWEAEPAPESYDIAAGRIERGTIAALHFSITGMVAGHPAVVVEHVTRTRDDLRPDWARPVRGRWLLPRRDHRRAVVRRRRGAEQRPRRPQPRRDRRRLRPDRERDPGRRRRRSRDPHHPRPPAADRSGDLPGTRELLTGRMSESS